MAVLVTGGAGYIGSHMVLALVDAGEEVTTVDFATAGEQIRHRQFGQHQHVAAVAAGVTNVLLGTAPCNCRYVGTSLSLLAGTAATLVFTVTPKIIPFDTGVAAALNTTDAGFGLTVAAFPAFTSSVDFDGQGVTVNHGQNGTGVATGITDAVPVTSTIFRQGDAVGLTIAGASFAGAGSVCVEIFLRERNGQS